MSDPAGELLSRVAGAASLGSTSGRSGAAKPRRNTTDRVWTISAMRAPRYVSRGAVTH